MKRAAAIVTLGAAAALAIWSLRSADTEHETVAPAPRAEAPGSGRAVNASPEPDVREGSTSARGSDDQPRPYAIQPPRPRLAPLDWREQVLGPPLAPEDRIDDPYEAIGATPEERTKGAEIDARYRSVFDEIRDQSIPLEQRKNRLSEAGRERDQALVELLGEERAKVLDQVRAELGAEVARRLVVPQPEVSD